MTRAKKRLGQHFLSDPRILARIADAVQATPQDTILEIGPGLGALTAELVRRAGTVIAIERDVDLITTLRQRVPGATIVAGDALALQWHELAASRGVMPGALLIAGNIPYNITSPLIDKALEPPLPRRIVFLVQREVADRVIAPPGSAEYGALTVGVQVVTDAERLFTVPAGAFQPRPRVDSAVLRLTPRAEPLVSESERAGFRRFVVGLFGFRRKQLARGLRELTGWSADAVGELLRESGVAPSARPETLTPVVFVTLHRRLVDAGWSAS